MTFNIDWRGMVKAILKAALPFLFGAGVVSLTGCGTMQTPNSKSQTSSIYAFGLPAVIITHDQKQVADNTGADENSAYSTK